MEKKMIKEEVILFSGSAQGAETYFGEMAEKFGLEEVNFSFEGREHTRTRGIRILTHEELQNGDVSLAYISKLMNRQYSDTAVFKKIIQTIWHQINNSRQIFVIGKIMPDNTVKGGTGWGAEFAKICNKCLYIFDQDKSEWMKWVDGAWTSCEAPTITHNHFCGTGTRMLNDNGKRAIDELFERSFK